MSELWQGILIGALFAIPVGIATNLLTVPIQTALNKRIKVASEHKAQENDEFEAQAHSLVRDRTALWTYLLEALIRIAWIGALAGVISGFFVILNQGTATGLFLLVESGSIAGFEFPLDFGLSFFSLAAQFAALIGALLIMNIARRTLGMMARVKAIRQET